MIFYICQILGPDYVSLKEKSRDCEEGGREEAMNTQPWKETGGPDRGQSRSRGWGRPRGRGCGSSWKELLPVLRWPLRIN